MALCGEKLKSPSVAKSLILSLWQKAGAGSFANLVFANSFRGLSVGIDSAKITKH
jgi:hypothetical protein